MTVAHAFDEEIVFAVEALRRGEIVAFPTETYYALGVDALDELALARLRLLKGRKEKAISVLVDGPEMLGGLVSKVSPRAAALMRGHWPGALTLALPARRGIPAPLVSEGCIAVRQSPHPTAQALVARFGRPITATSANKAGEPPATTAEAVDEAFEGRCRILHGGSTPGGQPSTLARVRGDKVEILRRGAVDISI
jgi:L-threonylcarbamoyladenylate synthase